MTTRHEFILLAADDKPPADADRKPRDESPEARMKRRFPQPIRVGDLIGLPVIDDDNRVFGRIGEVVRTPQDKVVLVVSYGGWLGLFTRAVGVPIEVVAIVGRQVASLDMKPEQYRTAPTWVEGSGTRIPDDEITRIALARR